MKNIKIEDRVFALPESDTEYGVPGLTKRELYAAMAMTGFVSAGASRGIIPTMALEMADALIKELDK